MCFQNFYLSKKKNECFREKVKFVLNIFENDNFFKFEDLKMNIFDNNYNEKAFKDFVLKIERFNFL